MDDGYYHGINKLKKPATKVMAPPGGATHINVFETPEPETQKPINKCQEARSKSSVFAGPEEMNPSRDTSSVSRQTHVSAPDDKSAQSTSTKVLAPPGGRTNFSIFASGNEEAKPQETRKPQSTVTSQNIFGSSAPQNNEVIGQRARNRQPPGGASHNIFG